MLDRKYTVASTTDFITLVVSPDKKIRIVSSSPKLKQTTSQALETTQTFFTTEQGYGKVGVETDTQIIGLLLKVLPAGVIVEASVSEDTNL